MEWQQIVSLRLDSSHFPSAWLLEYVHLGNLTLYLTLVGKG